MEVASRLSIAHHRLMLPSSNAPSPQLHAVVEAEVDENCDWIRYPPKPWPRYIRLWAQTEPEAVALVVGTLATWGRDAEAWSAQALEKEFPSAVPGGIAAVDGETLIGPSCCCGLEDWRQWLEVLATGRSPWMGHDPTPFVKIQADQVCIWADGGFGGTPRTSVDFSVSGFEAAIGQAARDLAEFEVPLREWLDSHAPKYAESLARQFREQFISSEETPAPKQDNSTLFVFKRKT